MADEWERKPEYSHGYLVPFIGLALLWYRFPLLKMGRPGRHPIGVALLVAGTLAMFVAPAVLVREWGFLFAGVAIAGVAGILRPSELDVDRLHPTWWGLPFLVLGVGVRLIGAHFYLDVVDHLSLIPCVIGLVLLIGGRVAIRWSWPAILFLVFMVPLPYTLETMLRGPLRKVGTVASTFLMQTVGLPAFADGHRHEVLVGGMTQRIGVSEACSGLSMLMIFFALATAVAVVIRRPLWEKAILLSSAAPIALVSNVLRITVTGLMLYALKDSHLDFAVGSFVLLDISGTDFAHSFFHDWAGWLMMPLALGFLWFELAILRRLVLVEDDVPLALGLPLSVKSSADTNGQATSSERPPSSGFARETHAPVRANS
ncbi:MAG: exosortase/archaeosortase family protein [Planctomycetaceae bacterium]